MQYNQHKNFMHHSLTPFSLRSIASLFALALLPACFSADRSDLELTWDTAAEIIDSIEAPEIPTRVYSIVEYGAQPGLDFDSLPAVKAALADAVLQGGGKLVFPEGRWFIKGPIHLKSHIELHLEAGAEIVFSEDPADYLPAVLTRWEGSLCFNYSPLVYAFQATDIAITGTGTLNGNAADGFATWRPQQQAAQLRLRQMGNDLVPVHQRVFGEGDFLRPPFIQFFGCERVLMEGVTVTNSPFWCIHPVFCSDVVLRGVTVNSYHKNNDGVDPDSSRNVLIEDCTFLTGDDSVAIKAGRDQDGWNVGRPTECIVIRNCEMPDVHNALAVGSEMSGGVQSIFMENCRIGSARSCIYFKSNPDRGGYIRGVRVRNIQVGTARTNFIDFLTDYPGWRGNNYPAQYSDFVIEDVSCEVAEKFGIYAVGKPEAPVSDITLRNVSIDLAKQVPQFLALAQNITFENVSINGEQVAPKIYPADTLGNPEEERTFRNDPLESGRL
ncbi:glycoside hydrolase family 28 protein [Pelagicoccus enzymogenes]|nr:glycoside hydrolase family 28 protein [Pelagicoccus enzymogenes]